MRQYTKAIYSACLELFQSNVEDGRAVIAAHQPRLALGHRNTYKFKR